MTMTSLKLLVKSVFSVSELIDVLTARIDHNDQFFLVIRRGATLERQLTIWDRQSKKKSPTMKLMVHFAGEKGIDSGAIHKEFLTSQTYQERCFQTKHQ